MSMHGEKEKRKRKEKGHLAFQVPFLHVLAQSHESGTNGELTLQVSRGKLFMHARRRNLSYFLPFDTLHFQ